MSAQKPKVSIELDIIKESCALCKAISTTVCRRCGEFYCSSDCQLQDWREHRKKCLPMPTLVLAADWARRRSLSPDSPREADAENKQPDAEPQQQAQGSGNGKKKNDSGGDVASVMPKVNVPPQLAIHEPPAAAKPKDGSPVIITAFRSTHRCYVRSLAEPENSAYRKLLSALAEYATRSPPLMDGHEGFAIAIQSNVLYRVRILQVNQRVQVRFIDSGLTRWLRTGELRQIPQTILEMPLFTSLVQLANVPNIQCNLVIRQHLSQFEYAKKYRIQYRSSTLLFHNVDLYEWQSGQLLNDKVSTYLNPSSNGNADKDQCLTDQQSSEPVMTPPFQYRPVAETNIKATILDNSFAQHGFVGCIASANLEHLVEINRYLRNYVDTKLPYKPKPGEYCLAKSYNRWYRGKVYTSVNEQRYGITYIDYTNQKLLTPADIRRYPSDFKTDCYTNMFLIKGLPPYMTEAQQAKLKSLLPVMKEFTIDAIIACDSSNIRMIECQRILNDMKDVL